MLRSNDTRTRRGIDPAVHQGPATEAHHDLGAAEQGQGTGRTKGALGSSAVTTPTTPFHPGAPTSTETAHMDAGRSQARRSSSKRIWSGERAPARTKTAPAPGLLAQPRGPGRLPATAPVRCHPP